MFPPDSVYRNASSSEEIAEAILNLGVPFLKKNFYFCMFKEACSGHLETKTYTGEWVSRPSSSYGYNICSNNTFPLPLLESHPLLVLQMLQDFSNTFLLTSFESISTEYTAALKFSDLLWLQGIAELVVGLQAYNPNTLDAKSADLP